MLKFPAVLKTMHVAFSVGIPELDEETRATLAIEEATVNVSPVG